jgi:hypothetical protein
VKNEKANQLDVSESIVRYLKTLSKMTGNPKDTGSIPVGPGF